jgi:hypothetical protein
MGKSSSYEANSSSVGQEIPRILWHTKVDLDVHKLNILECIMSYPTYFRTTLILSSHIQLDIPGGVFPSGYPTKTLYAVLVSYICATSSAHLTLLDPIARTILGRQHK